MKIQILDLAKEDLIEGYRFYEDVEAGLGGYFLTNLYTDIDSRKRVLMSNRPAREEVGMMA
ncbi:MAG: hypothetical protein J0L73_14280 [Verrucomicrobia bacterium]|nr:hypothetical protein [Verrucomicrobiota bacterium]